MALDPRFRKSTPQYRPGIDNPPRPARAPWIIGGLGLIGMLALVYYFSVVSLPPQLRPLFTWTAQSPP